MFCPKILFNLLHVCLALALPSLGYSLSTVFCCVTTPCPMKGSTKSSFAVERRPIHNQGSIHLGFELRVIAVQASALRKKETNFVF